MVTKDFEPAPVAQLPHGYTVERHAREMVEGHYPNHREYLVAAAYLEQQAAIADHARIVAGMQAKIDRFMLLCGQLAKLLEAENVRLPDGFTVEAAAIRFAEELAERRERAEALEASLAACRADAERLDWLSLHPRGAQIMVDGSTKDCVFWGVSSDPENTLRDAIDAARSQP